MIPDRKSLLESLVSGWRGISLITITYVFFLIFAQFAFLNRLGQLGIADTHLQFVMGAMAVGGILTSLVAPSVRIVSPPRLRLQIALLLCAVGAALSTLSLNLPGSIALSFLIGSSLGLVTVTLVSNLPLWLGGDHEFLKIGLGTGIGYLICNLPALFTAGPRLQAVVAALMCLVGVASAAKESRGSLPPLTVAAKSIPFPRVLLSFTSLVWLDSAAFFIIQSTPVLKAGTWDGTLHLWANGLLHLGAAILSAILIRRKGLLLVLSLSVFSLAASCLLLHQPAEIILASLFYPVGVSLYSVALVAYPSLLAPAISARERGRIAGLIYAVAGWFGSAMGIGMGQHLKQVPAAFVLLAATLILAPALWTLIRNHLREVATVAAGIGAAYCLYRAIPSTATSIDTTAIQRGRQVYISEGCINCHSQYVRPHTTDVLMWGPAQSIDELRLQRPPLFGNRRQGPDLSQVGGRRSPLWLKAHFFGPSELSHASFMPSYAYLFANSTRGDDLVGYLAGLRSAEFGRHISLENEWLPSASSAANIANGAQQFNTYCTTCHASWGATRLAWKSSFNRLPPDLAKGPWKQIKPTEPANLRLVHLERIIKFGIPQTDMPGHEYLSDIDISSIALWLNQNLVVPDVDPAHHTSGEKP